MKKKTIKMPPKKYRNPLDQKNPVVTLVDCKTKESKYYLHVSQPPSATLFNNPAMSDICLKVGEHTFYAHKLILSASSDVFARMLNSDWLESKQSELVLQEDDECVKVFERFLKYLYSGKILINKDYVFTLFLLADKYNVKGLYDECVVQIEKGLGVHVQKETETPAASTSKKIISFDGYSSSSSDTSEASSPPPFYKDHAKFVPSYKNLIPSETFPLNQVIRMLSFAHNEKIYDAALYNLEVRLGKQLANGDYKTWNLLDHSILMRIIEDNNFYCQEYTIFKAAKAWLLSREERQTTDIMTEIFNRIRFGVMSPDELYDVEADRFLNQCADAVQLVKEAIRYKLFKDCPRALAKENWTGSQFMKRQVKTG
ncbi:BTB/POZ domain-containing protein 17-like [Lineus longissimus]|uniref:BTB/POZ domain-containing protein 17-like n=1 Tax=Lineus longissimus TaxID=88925 RepID=UPI00315DC064